MFKFYTLLPSVSHLIELTFAMYDRPVWNGKNLVNTLCLPDAQAGY